MTLNHCYYPKILEYSLLLLMTQNDHELLWTTVGPRTTLILGTRKISVFRKQCMVGYYIGTSKNRVSGKFLYTLYTKKSVYIKFLEPIKNSASAKSMLKEAVYNEARL